MLAFQKLELQQAKVREWSRYRHTESAMLPLLKFSVFSDVYIALWVIRNLRMIRNARFAFLCMQLSWLENWTSKVWEKIAFKTYKIDIWGLESVDGN